MTPNGQNNIKNEFHTPELVEIEVLRVYILSKGKKNRFSSWPTAAIFDFAPRSHIFDLRA